MKNASVIIKNRAGIHARPSTKVCEIANKFVSSVELHKNGETANAKSVMSIIALGIAYNAVIEITVAGTDEDQCMKEMTAILNSTFDFS
jgi:phosphocarrier protein HPr